MTTPIQAWNLQQSEENSVQTKAKENSVPAKAEKNPEREFVNKLVNKYLILMQFVQKTYTDLYRRIQEVIEASKQQNEEIQKAQKDNTWNHLDGLPPSLKVFLNLLRFIVQLLLGIDVSAQNQKTRTAEFQEKTLEFRLALTELQLILKQTAIVAEQLQGHYTDHVKHLQSQNKSPMNRDGTYTRAILRNGKKIGRFTVTETTDELNHHKHFDIHVSPDISLSPAEKKEGLRHVIEGISDLGEKHGYTISAKINADFVGGPEGEKLNIKEAYEVLSNQQTEQEKKSLPALTISGENDAQNAGNISAMRISDPQPVNTSRSLVLTPKPSSRKRKHEQYKNDENDDISNKLRRETDVSKQLPDGFSLVFNTARKGVIANSNYTENDYSVPEIDATQDNDTTSRRFVRSNA
jgi:hypothetical protein